MFLNQGKFRQNGGCGYVLKPKVMNNPNGTGISNCCMLLGTDKILLRMH